MNLERILLRKPHDNTLCFLCFPRMRRIVVQGCIQEHHIYLGLLIKDCFFRPTNEVYWHVYHGEIDIVYVLISVSKLKISTYPNGINRRRSFIALS